MSRLARQNAALLRQEKSLNDPSTIVSEARRLGMVRPGERPYVITGKPSR
jgi:cell division protein FtsB